MRIMVGGTFDAKSGQPSGLVQKLHQSLGEDWHCHNGGSLQQLEIIRHEMVPNASTILWMPAIPNEEPKFVEQIKTQNPKCVLITSKRNNNEYSYLDLIARLLHTRSNLGIEINSTQQPFTISLFDPLGNVFTKTENIDELATVLKLRLQYLENITRWPSAQIEGNYPVPNKTSFFKLIRQYAETFHELVHAVHQDRFLGNAAFRCLQGGFPAMRGVGQIFVSRRNMDKRMIGAEGFVPVSINYKYPRVEFYGPHKPSVDAPCNLILLDDTRPWQYSIHSHAYIKGAPFTNSVRACGDVWETRDIIYAISNQSAPAMVNLTGHGSIILSKTIKGLQNIPYIARPMPEYINLKG